MIDQPAIDFTEIVDTRMRPPPVWLAYPGGTTFEVLVRPLGVQRDEFLEQARRLEWDPATMTKKVVIDEEYFLHLFAAWVLVDWRGLTINEASRLVLLRDPGKAKQIQGEIPCGEEAKMVLLHHSPSFRSWLDRVCVDMERFNQEREKQAKKKLLRPCATGSTTPASTAGNAAKIIKRMVSSRNATIAGSAGGTMIPSWPWPAMLRRALMASWIRVGWRSQLLISRYLPIGSHWCAGRCWRLITL